MTQAPIASSPTTASAPAPRGRGLPALLAAGLAALLASGCCVMPLVLALVGISGAWIGELRHIEPYSPWLLGLAVVALGVAGWQIYRRPPVTTDAACALGDSTCVQTNRWARRWFWVVVVLTLMPIVVPLIAPWFYD
jgi:mercuric ion transport protein